jgi:osmotically-inducible protein OsmY
MQKTLFAIVVAIGALSACKSHSDGSSAADNTARNRVTTPTADNAVATPADRDVTQKIRKAVMDDSSLSTNAHNCKIVVQNGDVTLVGPVASAAEREKVEQIASTIAGDHKVINQLEVTN